MRHGTRTAFAVTAVVFLAAAGAARAEEAHIYIAPHAWFGDLSGDGAAGPLPTDRFDVADDLEADGVDLHLGFDALVRLGRHRIVVGVSSGEHDGDALNSSIEIERARLFYGFALVNMKIFDLGVLVGADRYKVTTEAGGSGFDLDAPAPAIGVHLGIRPPVIPLRFYAEAVFSSWEISGVDTTLTDAYAALDWYLIPVVKLFGVQVGYRLYDLESEDTDTKERATYKVQGPFAGVVLRF